MTRRRLMLARGALATLTLALVLSMRGRARMAFRRLEMADKDFVRRIRATRGAHEVAGSGRKPARKMAIASPGNKASSCWPGSKTGPGGIRNEIRETSRWMGPGLTR